MSTSLHLKHLREVSNSQQKARMRENRQETLNKLMLWQRWNVKLEHPLASLQLVKGQKAETCSHRSLHFYPSTPMH